MAEMIMIEDSNGNIYWECSECKEKIRDKKGFEDKTKTCPKCGATVTAFYSLFDENGEYLT